MNDTWTSAIAGGRKVQYSCKEMNETTCNVTAQLEGSNVKVQRLVNRTSSRKEVEDYFSEADFGKG